MLVTIDLGVEGRGALDRESNRGFHFHPERLAGV